MASYARKQYFIKKGLQTRFIWTVLLIIFLVFVIVACNFFFFGTYLKAELDSTQLTELKSVFQIVMDKLFDKIILLGIVNIFIIVVISLFFSHQIAGPIHKIEITLAKIRTGNIAQRFYFRKTDNLDELAKQLNDSMDYLVKPIYEIEENISKLETAKDMSEVKTVVAELKEVIAGYQVVEEEIKTEEQEETVETKDEEEKA